MTVRFIVSIVLVASALVPLVAREAPRLAELEVRTLADARVVLADLSLYQQEKPVYVANRKAWKVRYSPNPATAATGGKVSPVTVWVDDATGKVSKAK